MMTFAMKKQVICKYAKCLLDCVSKLRHRGNREHQKKKKSLCQEIEGCFITKRLEKQTKLVVSTSKDWGNKYQRVLCQPHSFIDKYQRFTKCVKKDLLIS